MSSMADPWTRYAHVPGLAITTIISVVLVALEWNGVTSTGRVYDIVVRDRTGVQIFIQVVAYLLGLMQVALLMACLSNASRLYLERRSITLDQLQFWTSMLNRRIDWNLPMSLLAISALFIAVTFGPAAVWVGAITPIETTTLKHTSVNTSVYSPDPRGQFWNYTYGATNNTVTYNDFGSFTYSPITHRSGQLLNTAAAAVATNSTTNKHSKNDLTQYTYLNRSYGIGAAAGLTVLPGIDKHLQSYNYTEIGYEASVSCIKNSSTLWGWYLVSDNPGKAWPDVFLANGTLPGGALDYYAQVSYEKTKFLTSISAHMNRDAGVIVMAGGENYDQLNQTQCSINFVPTEFMVAVDVRQKFINVTALRNGTTIRDMDPTTKHQPFQFWGCGTTGDDPCEYYNNTGRRGNGLIAAQASQGLKIITQINTSLYTSVVGDAFYASINNTLLAQMHGLVHPDKDAQLYAISRSFESLLDDYLADLSSAQIMIANDTQEVAATAIVGAVKFGQKTWIYAALIINFLMVWVFVFEFFRTNRWKQLLRFDYRDIKSLIIASSLRGVQNAQHVNAEYMKGAGEWTADASDRTAGALKVRLAREGLRPVILLGSMKDEQPLRTFGSEATAYRGVNTEDEAIQFASNKTFPRPYLQEGRSDY